MNIDNNTPPERDYLHKSWTERYEFTRAFSAIPALFCMIFLRLDVGYRLIKVHWLVVTAVIICVVCAVMPRFVEPHGWAFAVFGVVMAALGIFKHHCRWRDIQSGRRLHTFCPGTKSLLEFLPLPDFFKRNRRVYRFLDPLAVALVGVIVSFISHGFAVFVLGCAAGLAVFEEDLWRKVINRDLDVLDGLISSEIMQEVMESAEAGEPLEAQQQMLVEVGIATGADATLKKQIQIRKTKKRKAAPDNLATQEVARV